MKKSLYICNANNSGTGNLHTKNTALSVFSGVTSVIRCGLFAKHIQGVRSLFVHTRKTCYTMRTTNKQAMKVKYSNLFRNIILGTIITVSIFLLINDYFDGWAFSLEKAIGAALLYLGGKLYYRWYGYDLSEYRNEFRNYGNE